MSAEEIMVDMNREKREEEYKRMVEGIKSTPATCYEPELSYDYLSGFYDGIMAMKGEKR